jgi:membrane protein YdbS with pleckstrin-like domain
MTTSNTGGFDPNATIASAPAVGTPAGAPPTGPHAPPDHDEITYYEGSPLVRGRLGTLLLCGLIGLILIALPITNLVFHWHWPLILDGILVVVGLLLFLVPSLRTRSIRYRITNYRIDYERGILGRNIDTLELWHVEDLHFHQSLLGRLLNVGSIIVTSRDETLPKLELHSLPNPKPLYETLKQRVIAVKRQQGVLKVDPG